jgi:hypothetical protein
MQHLFSAFLGFVWHESLRAYRCWEGLRHADQGGLAGRSGPPSLYRPSETVLPPVSLVFDSSGNSSTTAAGSCFGAIAVPEPEQQISAVSFAVP